MERGTEIKEKEGKMIYECTRTAPADAQQKTEEKQEEETRVRLVKHINCITTFLFLLPPAGFDDSYIRIVYSKTLL